MQGKRSAEENGELRRMVETKREVHESMQKMNPVGKENTRKKNMWGGIVA